MKREIITRILDKPQILSELEFLVDHFTENGESTCQVVFGFAWGNDYYPGNEWAEEEVSLDNLVEKVFSVEKTGIGSLAEDDLFVSVAGLEIQFCHESDIHISFAQHSREIEHFFSRWKEIGFEPSEWIKDQKSGPGTKVR